MHVVSSHLHQEELIVHMSAYVEIKKHEVFALYDPHAVSMILPM